MLPMPRKAVTEEDVKATEARLAESFESLKKSITAIPEEATKPVTDTVKAHPYATVGTAAGAGFALYSLLSLLIPKTKVIKREVIVQPQVEVKEREVKSFSSKLLSEAVALATPYITSYMENELARIRSKQSEPEQEKES
ncbi:MAG TPA: DUF883 C-terminal domain-containing protein [Methanocella sp.]|uniref:DUF883 C-terminal domain-containing protein n=1 Tax=Methanocella sp. TaxID=2052833 RepID=UPI002C1B5B04|nr:DUF883 C-terminal domain-containing protein [Methanocella sp.]HTY91093.1 DUF883 C-terminal domain-containing protein [Methanocella sp.]